MEKSRRDLSAHLGSFIGTRVLHDDVPLKPGLEALIVRLTNKGRHEPKPPPLLIELLRRDAVAEADSTAYPFFYRLAYHGVVPYYELGCTLAIESIIALRPVVAHVSSSLDPKEVEPLEFWKLIEVLTQLAAEGLAAVRDTGRTRELSELVAYEAIGLSRIYALARDDNVSEFFVDSEHSPLYLDHAQAGRCESSIVLTERERNSLVTHLDTFSGYTMDFRTPSMKNDMLIAGARLRVSLDLEPVSANRFSLDVRRLNMTSLSLTRLVQLSVLSCEAAGMMVGWLEVGGNITIVGETGTGKTTLLNALDEQVERHVQDALPGALVFFHTGVTNSLLDGRQVS